MSGTYILTHLALPLAWILAKACLLMSPFLIVPWAMMKLFDVRYRREIQRRIDAL